MAVKVDQLKTKFRPDIKLTGLSKTRSLITKHSHGGLFLSYCKDTGYSDCGKSLNYLANKDVNNSHFTYWYSYNQFYSINGKISHSLKYLYSLNCFYIDFDCNRNGVSTTVFIQNIPLLLRMMKVALPNAIVFSGHGVHFIYVLDKPIIYHHGNKHSHKYLRAWNGIEKQLIHTANQACLDLFGEELADRRAKDPTRLFSIPDSYNNKGTKPILIKNLPRYESNQTYSFNYWYNRFPYHPRKQNQQHKIQFIHYLNKHIKKNITNWDIFNLDRIYDFSSLAKHGDIPVGKRDLLLYNVLLQYSRLSDSTTVKARELIVRINNELTQPLPEEQINSLMNEYTKGYFTNRYVPLTNVDLIELFNITPKRQKQMSVIKIGSGKSNKVKHHRAHLKRIKQQHKNDLIKYHKIIQLKHQGLTKAKIARKLNTSRPTLNRIIKRIKS